MVAPARRRLSGMAIAAICLAAVIVLGGAGVGTWLALRSGDNDGATTASTTDTVAGNDQAEIDAEKLSLAGRVVLPDGTAISPGSLTVLSNTGDAPCSATGDFDVSAIHDEGARTLVFAMNGSGNPVVMALVESSASDLQPSVASTARALVLYDPAFLSLPKAAYDSAAAKLESHPDLPALEDALTSALTADPSSPLDGDAHPEPYDLAAKIAADLLADIIVIDENAAAEDEADQATAPQGTGGTGPLLLAAAGDFSPGPVLVAEGSGSFVDVIDDPEHATTEVRLVNTTWATYTVTWTCETAGGKTSTGEAMLPRCAPWRVDVSSLTLGWPPVGFKLEKLVKVGDGDLSFIFKRNDDFMAFNVAADIANLLVGAGGEAIRKVAGGGSDMAAAAKTYAAAFQAAKELGALGGRLQGQSLAGAAKEVGGFFLVNGGRLLIAFWPLMQNEIKEEFVTVMGRVITRRMAALAVLGYGSVDVIAQLKALGDSSLASYSTGGLQVAGIYPFSAGLTLSADTKDDKTYVFEAVISGLPENFSYPSELVIDFGDGKTEKKQPNVEAGQAVVAFKHTYGGDIPAKARAVLQTAAETPAVMASAEAELSAETAGSSASGVYKTTLMGKLTGLELTLDFATGIVGSEGWANVSLYAAGLGVGPIPVPLPVTVQSDGSLVIGGSQYGLAVTCTPSADGNALTDGTVTVYSNGTSVSEKFTASR
jgi:hypothetical protein